MSSVDQPAARAGPRAAPRKPRRRLMVLAPRQVAHKRNLGRQVPFRKPATPAAAVARNSFVPSALSCGSRAREPSSRPSPAALEPDARNRPPPVAGVSFASGASRQAILPRQRIAAIERHQKDDDENEKQNARHTGRGGGHAAKSKHTRHQATTAKISAQKACQAPKLWNVTGRIPAPLISLQRPFRDFVAMPQLALRGP